MNFLRNRVMQISGLFLLLFLATIPFSVDAATYTWDGGGVDENWSTCANWSSDTCPLTGDSVIFSGTSVKNVTVDANISITSFNMNAGYTGVLTSGSNLITIGGNFTQADGTFNASAATTTIKRSFTYTGGTFNHNSGIVYFLSDNTGAATITSNAAVFNTVVFDTSTTVSFTTNIGSDMTIAGNLIMQNSLGTHNLQIQSSLSNTTRNLAVAGNFIFPSNANTRLMSYGSGGATYGLNVVLQGNLDIADSNVNFYANVTFASSSDQTVTRSAGTVSTVSNWYDTGSGNLALTSDFVGSQTLNADSAGDFAFASTPYSFTVGTVSIAGGESFTASGINMLTLSNDLTLSTGTFNMNASTTLTDDLIISGGVFNAGAGTTTLNNNFTHTSGTFNHENGTVVFSNDNTGGQTITATSTVFNNVVFDTTSTVLITTSIASDMTIAGNLIMQNSLGTNTLTVQSSVSGTTRNLAVARNFLFPSTANIRGINYGASGGTNDLNVTLQGNLDIADSNAVFYTNVTFASSSNQTIALSAGSVSSVSNWYDTGSGDLVLTANFTGSQILQSDSPTDFNFSTTSFSFTAGSVVIAPGTVFTPTGPATYNFSAATTLSTGTINMSTSTIFANSLTIAGATFNATANSTTTLKGNFTYTSGTFNHNNGTVFFANTGGSTTLTPNGATFNNVYVDLIGAATVSTLLASDMTVNGNFYLMDSMATGHTLTFSSSAATPRILTIAGDLIFPSTAPIGTILLSNTTDTLPISTVLYGNLVMNDSSVAIYGDITFASSSNQTITKNAGNINSTSDWYDTGSGNITLVANTSGSQVLRPDNDSDFAITTPAYSFTVGNAIVAPGTSYTPTGASSYVFTTLTHSTGTFNAGASTTIASFTQSGGVFNATPNSTTTFSGLFTYTSGTFNHNDGLVYFANPGVATNITAPGVIFNDVSFNLVGAASVSTLLVSDMTVNGTLYLQDSAATGHSLALTSNSSGVPRTITVGEDVIFPANAPIGGFTLGNAADTLRVNLVVGGNISILDQFTVHIYGDITLNGTSTQTITKTYGTIYSISDWLINKPSGEAVLATSFASAGTFNIATGTLRTAGNTLTTAVSGLTVGAAGILQMQGGETVSTSTLATSSTVVYEGTSGPYTLKNWSYKNLTIQGSGATFNLPATLTGLQNVNIASGTLDVTASNYGITVQGNWINTGTFNPRSGTVTLSGTDQHITGTTTFYNLTKSVAAADTLTFGASQTQTISNTWTANGAPGQLLSLRSSTPATRWNIDPQSTRTLSYIDVQDSNNTNGSAVGAVVGIVDSGNNLNWGFDTTPPGATSIVVTPATSTASVTWNTDEAATSTFKYGLTSAYGNASTSLGTSTHSVIVSGLTPETTYHYAVVSSDGGGNTATTTDGTFTTNALPDTTAPNINTVASSTGTSTATISWVTTENASSSVLYGTTISYGSVATSSGTTTHSVNLSGLTPSTTYHFAILALDAAINASTTADMTFTTAAFDPTAPTVSVTAPANLATVSGASVSITANASDNTAVVGVQFKLNTSTNIGLEDTTSTYGVTWDSTAVADGAHTIIAVARDAAGNYATSSVVNVTVDNTAAVRSAGLPTGSLPVNTTDSVLSLSTNENATCRYSTTAAQAFGSMTLFTNTGTTTHAQSISGLTNGGSYTYYVKCSDAQSNINATDYTISFTVAADASSPVVSITAPTNSSTVSGSTYTVTANATDDVSVSGVQFKLDGVNLGIEDVSAAYQTVWNTTLVADGSHTLLAVARDGSSNYATSAPIVVTVDNTAPVRSAGSPTTSLAAGTTNITLSVVTDESATCKYDTSSGTAYGSMSGTFSTTGSTNHSTTITGLSDGNNYTYYVRCSDGQSNINATDYVISFAVDAPVIVPSTPDPTPDRILGAWNQPTITGDTQVIPPPQLQPQQPVIMKFIFKKDLGQGVNNVDVKELQKFLNNNGFAVARVGAGSPGKETTLFGPATKAAVLKFQIANKIKGANGRFGPATRGVVNAMR